MVKKLLKIGALLSILLFTGAAKSGQSAFTFSYNIGTTTNYHAYGFAATTASMPQPAGTLGVGGWWVWDLGSIADIGSVVCPKPLKPFTSGSMILMSANDVNWLQTTNQSLTLPAAAITQYNKGEEVEIDNPHNYTNSVAGITNVPVVILYGEGLPYWTPAKGPVDFRLYFPQ